MQGHFKEIIDTRSSFSDWLNNQNVRNQLKLDIKICLVKNGYPPQYSPEVFRKVMDQVENFEENNNWCLAKSIIDHCLPKTARPALKQANFTAQIC